MDTGPERGQRRRWVWWVCDRVCVCCLLNRGSFNEAGTEDILSHSHTEEQLRMN